MASTDPSLFLTLSGNRCGSTWLTFMLNALPDVAAEFELQWTETAPSQLHVGMKRPDFDLRAALDAVSGSAPIRGSKMVLPGSSRLAAAEYRAVAEAIPNGVKLVHLSRNYFDSFLSKFRDAGHIRNPDGVAPPPRSGAWLIDAPADDYGKPRHMDHGASEAIDPHLLVADLTSRLAHEEFFCSLAARTRDYLMVDYGSLVTDFEAVARHVGSRASSGDLQRIVLRQPTRKLPPLDYARFIANFSELAQIGAEFEITRQELLAKRGGVWPEVS